MHPIEKYQLQSAIYFKKFKITSIVTNFYIVFFDSNDIFLIKNTKQINYDKIFFICMSLIYSRYLNNIEIIFNIPKMNYGLYTNNIILVKFSIN